MDTARVTISALRITFSAPRRDSPSNASSIRRTRGRTVGHAADPF